MITFTISTKKGGVGKTTTSISLLDIFTSMGFKCLGVDLDGQGNLTKTAGISEFSYSARDLFLSKSIPNPYPARGFDIIPASANLDEVERHIFDRYNSHTILKTNLNKYAKNYDFCIIDCSSSIDMITRNALVAAEHVICPIAPEGWSFDGFDQIENEVEKIRTSGLNSTLDIACVILQKYHKKYILNKTIADHFKESKYSLFTVREKLAIAESQYQAVSILDYDPDGTATKDLIKVAQYLKTKYVTP